jgi:hypothetical protein
MCSSLIQQQWRKEQSHDSHELQAREQLNAHNSAQLCSSLRCVFDYPCHSASTWHTCLLRGLCHASKDTLEDGLGGGQRHAVDGHHCWWQAAFAAACCNGVALPYQLMHHQRLACTIQITCSCSSCRRCSMIRSSTHSFIRSFVRSFVC